MFINKIFLVFNFISDSLDDVHVNSKHITAADCQGNNNNMHILFNFKLLYTGTSGTIKSIGSVDQSVDSGEISATMTCCNKETGTGKKHQQRTRGIWLCASGGGHIQMWQPLYQ